MQALNDPIDFAAIASALTGQFPDLAPVGHLEVLGTGFWSVVLSSSTGWVFRLARSAGAARRQRGETEVVPIVSRSLAVEVPGPIRFIEPSVAISHGGTAYRRLRGVTARELLPDAAVERSLVTGVARFLVDLHLIDLAEFPSAGEAATRHERSNPTQERTFQNVRQILSTRLTSSDLRGFEHWWESLLDEPKMRVSNRVLVHGDVTSGNLLVDPSTKALSGVLDWEMAAIGDPAIDFFRLPSFSATFKEEVLEEYRSMGGPADDNLLYRTEKMADLDLCYRIQGAAELANWDHLERDVLSLRQAIS